MTRLYNHLTELSATRDVRIEQTETQYLISAIFYITDEEFFSANINKVEMLSGVEEWYEDLYGWKFKDDLNHSFNEYTIGFSNKFGSQVHNPYVVKDKRVVIRFFAALMGWLEKIIKSRKPEIIKYESFDQAASRLKLYETLAKKIERSGKYERAKTRKSGKWAFVRKDLIK